MGRSQQPQGHVGTPVSSHLCVSREHLDPLRGDKQIHLRHGLGLPLRCLQSAPVRSLPHSRGPPCAQPWPEPTRGQAVPPHTLILSTASCACAMRTLVGGFLSETSCVEPRYFAPKITPSSRSSGSQGPGTEILGGIKQGLVSS